MLRGMADHGPDASESERSEAADSPREQELLRQIAALRMRIAELEAHNAEHAVRASALPPPPPPPPFAAPMGSSAGFPANAAYPAPPVVGTIPPLPMQSAAESRPALSLEQFIGRRVVPMVGAVAVLAAVGYLVNYAIEIGLIGRVPAEVRFGAGVLIGIALLGAGEWVRRRGAPGAAMGLDAAGVGAVMVSVALGVFSLGIFGGGTATVIAAAAAVLAAGWSLRCGSVAVTIVALIGVYAMPASVGLVRDAPRQAAVMLALALAIGLATHLFGGARFAAARYLAVVAAILLGTPVLASIPRTEEACAFALAWWFLVISEGVLSSQRGVDARGNAVNSAIASMALVLIPIGLWPGGDLVPLVAGGALCAGALLLRPMAVVPTDDEERSALGQSGVAIGEACGMLARTFAALALLLGLGGLVFVVGDALRAPALAATAVAGAWIGRRYGLLAFDLIALVLGGLAVVVGGFLAIEGATVRTTVAAPPFGMAPFVVAWSAELAGLAVSVIAVLVMTSVARLHVVSALLVPVAVAGWVVCSARLLAGTGVLGCVPLLLPALVVAWISRARMATVAAAVVLCAVAAVWCAGSTLEDSWGVARGGAAELLAVVVPWIAAVVMLAHHPAFGAARRWAVRVAVAAAGVAVAFVVMVLGSHRGFDGIDAGLAAVIGLSAAAAMAVGLGRALKVRAVLEAGLLLAVVMLGVAGMLGFLRVFERSPSDASPPLELGAFAASALVTGLGWRLSRAVECAAWARAGLGAVAAFSVAPLVALLLGSVVARPLPAAVAVGSLMIVGVAELVIGFRRQVAALRWAGLACFGILVLRLYAVDLADAPMLVRIGLLFASGMVLVGTGVAYARITRRSA